MPGGNIKRQIELVVKATSKDAEGALGSLTSKLKGLKVGHLAVAAAAAAMTAALTRAYAKAVESAQPFEKSLAEINTLINASPAQIKILNRQLSDMSVQFGQLDTVMARAQYDAISAGFKDVGDSLKILDVSGKAAIAGLTTIDQTTRTVTSILNAYGKSADYAGHVSDVLFTTIKEGVTTFPELNAAIGNVIATASVGGVKIEEVSAALASMTKSGINTFEAVTALNSLILALAAPTGEVKDKVDELGLSLKDGLGPALAKLAEVGEKGLGPLRELIPNIRALKAAAAAGKDGAREYTRILGEMERSAGATDTAFGIMSDTVEFASNRSKQAMDRLSRSIGETGLGGKKVVLNAIADSIEGIARVIEENSEPLSKLVTFLGNLVSLPLAAVAAMTNLEGGIRSLAELEAAGLKEKISGTGLAPAQATGAATGAMGSTMTPAEFEAAFGWRPTGAAAPSALPSLAGLGAQQESAIRSRLAGLPAPQGLKGTGAAPLTGSEEMDTELDKWREWYADVVKYQETLNGLMEDNGGLPVPEIPEDVLDSLERHKQLMEGMNQAIDDAKWNMANLGAQGITTLLGLREGTISLADAVRNILASALEQALTSFLALKVFGVALGLSTGGENKGMAAGGKAVHGAAGFTVPDIGPRGIDAIPALVQPGEGFVRRDTMVRLERFLAAQEAAAFSPVSAGVGGRGELHLHYDISRPISYRDHMALGRDAAEAARDYERRFV